MEQNIYPVFFKVGGECESPPAYRHGVSLIYNDGSVSVAQRDNKFAIIHVTNSRWFVTDAQGAELMQRYSAAKLRGASEFICSQSELIFLKRVIGTGFLEMAKDAPVDVPAVMCLSITDRCNLECSYCFYSASHKKNKAALHVADVPEGNLRSLLVQVSRLNKGVRVYLTGGEPFANKDIMEYFSLVKEAGLYVGVVTNGVMLTEKRLQSMRGLGVDEIRVSLDGVSKDTHEATRPGTYNKVMSSLKRLEGKGFRVVLSMTVTSANQHEARAIARFARECGFVVSYSHMVPTGRGADHKDMLPDYEQLVLDMALIERDEGFSFLEKESAQGWRRHTCGLAGQSLYVNLTGDAFPCNMLSKTGHKIGNLFSTPLVDVLKSRAAEDVRSKVDSVLYCRNCHVRYICGGPCRASSFFAIGTMQSRGPDCAFKYSEVIDSIFSHGSFISGQSL